MRRLQKTKKVSWASEVNLCQERLFSTKESPSQVVMGTQDHLQVCKNSPLGQTQSKFSPQVFGQTQFASGLSQIPLMKWRRPLRFEVNVDWEVVAGEESKEVASQRQREMRVLEAIYPRPSSVPPNPSMLVNVGDLITNDENIPVVPITPIEDDDDTTVTTNHNQMPSQPQNSQATITPNRNSVDRDLLIKILSDPNLVKKLTTSNRAQNMSSIGLPKQATPGAQNKSSNGTEFITPSLRPPTINAQKTMATQTGPFYPKPQIRTGPVACFRPEAPVKDINYFKSLIQQHGIERQDGSPSQEQHLNVVKSKPPKMMKRCMYYNSPKGCRKGAHCAFQHDGSALKGVNGFPEVNNPKRIKLDGVNGFPEVNNPKRIKLDGGIAGR